MKKLLAVLLSIMMLAMPLTSMAENSVWDNAARQETTITIHDLNADLVAALGVEDFRPLMDACERRNRERGRITDGVGE